MEDDHTDTVEYEQFVKLIRVLEDALERAAAILGPEARPASHRRDHIKRSAQVYEELSDLLDATREGRARLFG
jgi:hypothetical protein